MKAVPLTVLPLVDHIAAEAGKPEAQFDARLCALFSAYRHILKAGNRTQFNMVDVAIKQYSEVKACKEALQVTTTTAPVKRMHAVYLAYGAALAHVGVPAVMKGADAAAIDATAEQMALEFATMVQVALAPEVKAPVSAEDKAAKKALKEKEEKAIAKQAAADQAALVQAEAQRLAQASVVTMADMVAIVANAAKSGMLDAEQLALLDGALDAVAANIQLVPVEEPAPVHA